QTLGRSRGGLGLGLALVKGVTELHGGSVSAASDGHGKGALFTVELPLAGSAPPRSNNDSAQRPPAVRSRRVLVIEATSDSADSLKAYLEIHGHRVRVANSGPDGLNAATEFIPEVVICDVGLPGLDGYAVAAELRRISPTPPTLIIAISGHGARTGPD